MIAIYNSRSDVVWPGVLSNIPGLTTGQTTTIVAVLSTAD